MMGMLRWMGELSKKKVKKQITIQEKLCVAPIHDMRGLLLYVDV